ncbi:SMP-30/gluconolactonase/LRE family protein [Marinimicrobium sp. ABcell2]|uniref:SMP-30/gluconolactonase/LRE family protein n=1 Tax=Marinimicrobium sp. ABcell2 TaxID=3069751 RepID=UPI0027AFC38F|nr:SMP-30/gluconolactonase/LRE family protein [Marinimicrobium sp. ABcell2]MDQ2075648.1 SMP-30/gluconolactonase/LRE family protein [Marinimicrobium sp. ABcell2]
MKTNKILMGLIMASFLVACERDPETPETPGGDPRGATGPAAEGPIPTTAADPAEQEPRPQEWTCPAEPGTPPSGELVAERIEATATTRDAPGLYEGPAWLDGALYFSDFTFEDGFPSRIQRYSPGAEMVTAIPNSGTNGLTIDSEGYLLAATHDRKEISRYNPYTGERESIVGEFEGNVFNSPNDLTVTHDGVIYFTDPDFQRSAAPGGQPETRVYRVENGEVTVVDDTMANPNGIALSPNHDVLYVAGGGEEGTLRAYPIENGVPGEGVDIADVSVPDGMAIDCAGNIYATEHTLQRIRVFSPQGDELATIKVDANVTNPTFGGPDHRTLYIAGAGTIWKVELDIAGFPN